MSMSKDGHRIELGIECHPRTVPHLAFTTSHKTNAGSHMLWQPTDIRAKIVATEIRHKSTMYTLSFTSLTSNVTMNEKKGQDIFLAALQDSKSSFAIAMMIAKVFT